MFLKATLIMLDAIGKVMIIALVAGFVMRRKILLEHHIKGLSEATVKIFLPAFTFDKVLTTFQPFQMPDWWVLPMIGFGFPVLFMGITALFYLGKIRENMNKFPIASLQNVGYLVLPIGQILYPEQFDRFAIYVFLLILGFNIALWTIGKALISYQVGKNEIRLAEMITPPFVANIVAMLLVFIGLEKIFPQLLLEPISILGEAAVPLGMFILGATIGNISLRRLPPLRDIIKLSLVKYVLMPGLAIYLILLTGLNRSDPLLADVLVIEASAAPAANLIVIVKKYGGDEHFVSSMMLLMYIMAIFMMPLWLGVWKTMAN